MAHHVSRFTHYNPLSSEDSTQTTAVRGDVFATTHWTVVLAAGRGSSHQADVALEELCRTYWYPLYVFVRRQTSTREDAEDLTQAFFARFLEKNYLGDVQREKGKFRSFLLASLKHYIADVWDRERALKRGGNYEFVLLDEKIHTIETLYARESRCVAVTLDEEQQYEQSWAAALVARALGRIEAEFGNAHKTRLFSALKPFLTGGVGLPTQQEVARRLDIPIETLRSHLSRLRARYRELLREEVARTIGVAENVDEELHHLCTILTANC